MPKDFYILFHFFSTFHCFLNVKSWYKSLNSKQKIQKSWKKNTFNDASGFLYAISLFITVSRPFSSPPCFSLRIGYHDFAPKEQGRSYSKSKFFKRVERIRFNWSQLFVMEPFPARWLARRAMRAMPTIWNQNLPRKPISTASCKQTPSKYKYII